jgi:hypothetical protein
VQIITFTHHMEVPSKYEANNAHTGCQSGLL